MVFHLVFHPQTIVYLAVLCSVVRTTLALHGEAFHALLQQTPHEITRIVNAHHAVPPSKLSLSLRALDGRNLIVALTRHDELFAEGYEHITLRADGTVAKREPLLTSGHCVYRGQIFDAEKEQIGHALLSVCAGDVEGRLRIGEEHDLFVAPHPMNDGTHVVMRHADWGATIGAESWTCGVDDEVHHEEHSHDEEQHNSHDPTVTTEDSDPNLFEKRRRLLNGNVIKYVELLIVNDFARCDAFTTAGNTLSQMATRSAAIISHVDSLYASGHSAEPFFTYNIKVTVKAQVSFAEGNPYTAASALSTGTGTAIEKDVDDLLAKFGAWRIAAIASGIIPDHDNAQVLSGEDFAGTTVGYAPVGVMCRHHLANNG